MKILKYNLCTRVNHGTEEEPQIVEILFPATMGWSEANEEIAKREAYNGEYTIEEDGQENPVTPVTEDVSWDELAAAIREGVNEA